MLIRDGAILVRDAQDVIDALPPQKTETPREPRESSTNSVSPFPRQTTAQTAEKLHARILERLGPSPLAEDQLIRDLAASAGEVGPALVDLELDGKILRQAGGLLSRVG